MLELPITFTNFDGQEVTKKYYFNLTEAELAIRELESDGTWSETLERIKASNKGSVVMPEFKKIIKWTYLERSGDDGIDKSDAAWARFENSEPWSVLIMRLISEEGFSADFINSVMPDRIKKANVEAAAKPGFRPGANTGRPVPPGADTRSGAHAAIATSEPASVQPLQSASSASEDAEYQEYLRQKAAANSAPSLDNFNRTPADQPYNLPPEAGVEHTSTPRTDLLP